jgi:hypothetical protein
MEKKVKTMEELLDESSDDEQMNNAAAPDELYDAGKDEENEKFVQNTRRISSISDATLACPCCFTVLSYESQQHVEYKNQFRSLTVLNSQIKHDQVLCYEEEKYSPVCCALCGYECGVFGPQPEELYHFHDVLASDPL